MCSSLMNNNSPKKIVILGCGSAGVSAAINARKTSRKCQITIISREPITEYSRCGLPYAISGAIPDFEDLIIHPQNWYENLLKTQLLLYHNCTRIDIPSQELHLTDLTTDQNFKLAYDTLILATGSRPAHPPINGVEKDNIFPCWTIDDAKKIRSTAKNVSNVVVIGAGLIGMEIAESMHRLGKRVSIIEYLPEILPRMIDFDMAKSIRENIIPKDIGIYVNWVANSINGNEIPCSVTIQNRETQEITEIPAEMVILATGVRPNTELGQKAGIPVGPTNGFIVDTRQQTPTSNVFAVGDCAEYSSKYWNQPILPALGSIAVRQGRVAGINAVGGNAIVPDILINRVTKLFNHEIAAVGMTTSFAEKNQIELTGIRGRASSLPKYFPGGKDITLKYLFDKETQILKGAQIIGESQAAQRINVLSLAVNRLTANDLSLLETCYAPPIAPTWDVINVVGETASRRFNRTR